MSRYSATPVRVSPNVGQPASTAAMMGDVLVALLPALAMSVFFFGFRALVLCAVSVGSCVGIEYFYRRLTRQKQTVGDLSACVTGLLLAMSLPASSSYWVPVVGSLFAILVIKQLYGGLGKNFINPALGARMLLATFPILMTTWPQPMDHLALWGVDAVASATPMSFLHEGALPPSPWASFSWASRAAVWAKCPPSCFCWVDCISSSAGSSPGVSPQPSWPRWPRSLSCSPRGAARPWSGCLLSCSAAA